MKKNSDRVSIKKVIKLNDRALGIFYKRYPQMVVSRFANIAWRSLTPYVGIYLSALIIDELIGARDSDRLKMLVILSLGAAALIAVASAFLNRWMEVQNSVMWLKVENILSEKVMEMDYVSRDDSHTTDLLSTILQNQQSNGWGLFQVIRTYEGLCSAALTIIGGVGLTVSLFCSRVPKTAGCLTMLDHPLTIILVIATMLAVTFAAPMLTNKSGSYMAKYAGDHAEANRKFSFFGWLGYHRALATDMRIYRQDKICDRYNRDKEDTFCSKGLFSRLAKGSMGAYAAAGAALSVTFSGVAYLFVCLKALGGAFGLGAVTRYVTSITKVSEGMSNLVKNIGTMKNNTPFLEQTFEFLDIPNNMYKGSLTVEKRRDRKYQVEFRGVSFKYPGSDDYTLKNVNMKFEIGKRLAVVGMNGSGKTTFIKLLCRLYDPTEGEILLNGIDIRKYNYREYMDIFSVVFQDFKLLSLKLCENVASGVECDRELVTDCLEKAGFSDRLAEMKEGIDTYLYTDYNEKGVDLSGGEAQKIAIARALYKDAPFIILDEPTAALDPIAEAEIYEKFDAIAGDKTAIYISHRLSSCKFCDEIAVFHEGAVVQHGSHDALLSDESGKYYELWNAQAKYYVKEGAADDI